MDRLGVTPLGVGRGFEETISRQAWLTDSYCIYIITFLYIYETPEARTLLSLSAIVLLDNCLGSS